MTTRRKMLTLTLTTLLIAHIIFSTSLFAGTDPLAGTDTPGIPMDLVAPQYGFIETEYDVVSPDKGVTATLSAENMTFGEWVEWDLTSDGLITFSQSTGILHAGETIDITFYVNWAALEKGEVKRGLVFLNPVGPGTKAYQTVMVEAFHIYDYYDGPIVIPTPPINAKASSSVPSNHPSLAVDGNDSTMWGTMAGQDPEWIYVDMGKVKSFETIRVQWYSPYYATEFDVYTSNDTVNWTRVYSAGNANGRDTVINGEFECRYAGLYLKKSASVAYAIREISLYDSYKPAIDVTKLSNVNPAVYKDSTAKRMHVAGNTLYTAEAGVGLHVVDVTDKPGAEVRAIVPDTKNVVDVAVNNDIAMLACGNEGLKIVDISNPDDYRVISQVSFPFNNTMLYANRVVFHDRRYMYVAASKVITGSAVTSKVFVVNVENASQPFIVTEIRPADGGMIMDMDIYYGKLNLAVYNTSGTLGTYQSSIQTFTVAKPDAITMLYKTYVGGRVSGLSQDGAMTYIYDQKGRVQLYYNMGLSTTYTPKILSVIKTGKALNNLYVYKNIAFMSFQDKKGISVYDYRYKNKPSHTATVPTGTYHGMTVSDNHIYINEANTGLMIFSQN